MSVTSTRTYTVCDHPPETVHADILSGDFHGGPGGEQAVQWCSICGSYRRVFDVYGRPFERREGEWVQPSFPDGKGPRFF